MPPQEKTTKPVNPFQAPELFSGIPPRESTIIKLGRAPRFNFNGSRELRVGTSHESNPPVKQPHTEDLA